MSSNQWHWKLVAGSTMTQHHAMQSSMANQKARAQQAGSVSGRGGLEEESRAAAASKEVRRVGGFGEGRRGAML